MSEPPKEFVDWVGDGIPPYGNDPKRIKEFASGHHREQWRRHGRTWMHGFRAGQRAKAEKDAEIAERHECPNNDPDCNNQHNEIAAAIRAAAPKEEA